MVKALLLLGWLISLQEPISNRAIEIGQCYANCSEDLGICISWCQEDGQCQSKCYMGHGKCISRCNF